MATLLRYLTWREVSVEAPSLLTSLLIAELFYKFHSFTLECVAFLATWYACGQAARRLIRFKG